VRAGWQRWWLVDPLDGTKEFIAGSEEFTVNIALIEQGGGVWRGVDADQWPLSAVPGLGAWRADR
jgi:3'(2'), 5'-bisphosphate nucleotidase